MPRLEDFKGNERRYLDYLVAMKGALDRYCDLDAEHQIIKNTQRLKLAQGKLRKVFAIATEFDPRTGTINGYWACVAGWSNKVPPDDPTLSPYARELMKFFRKHPDIHAGVCDFCLVDPTKRKELDPVNFVPHLRPKHVAAYLHALCVEKGLDAENSYPYAINGVDTATTGKEAIRRWWTKKQFLNPSESAYHLMAPDAAARTIRAFNQLNQKRVYLHVANLFERVELDEHKWDAMFTVYLPLTNGRFKVIDTRRLWQLSIVECSCRLRLASTVAYGARYSSEDVLRLFYHSIIPPKRLEPRTADSLYGYRPDACFPAELDEFKNLTAQTYWLDSDSTHLSENVLEAIKTVLRCGIGNGLVGVPEKNAYVEQMHAMYTEMASWLPSATGNRSSSPSRKNPEAAAESLGIFMSLAYELSDIGARNWNVTPLLELGGLSPIQAAQDKLRDGKVYRSGLGEFSRASLYQFLPRNEPGEIVELSNMHGNKTLSPLVVRYMYGVYTSSILNRDKDLCFAANRRVTIYVQDDARFAFVVPHAFPNRVYKVALMGPNSAVEHTLEMRRLTRIYAKHAVAQDRARHPNVMVGALRGLALNAPKGSFAARAMGNILTYFERAGHGDLSYIDLSDEEQEQLLAEANEIAISEGFEDVEVAEVYAPKPSTAPLIVTPNPAGKIWIPPAGSDPFGIINASRY